MSKKICKDCGVEFIEEDDENDEDVCDRCDFMRNYPEIDDFDVDEVREGRN